MTRATITNSNTSVFPTLFKTDVENVKLPTKANIIAAKIPSIVMYSFWIPLISLWDSSISFFIASAIASLVIIDALSIWIRFSWKWSYNFIHIFLTFSSTEFFSSKTYWRSLSTFVEKVPLPFSSSPTINPLII